MTFFPDNWQDFTSATKPCLSNLVDSLISPPLVPEHSCVVRNWVGSGTPCTWWATREHNLAASASLRAQTSQLPSSFPQVYTAITIFSQWNNQEKKVWEVTSPGLFRKYLPNDSKFLSLGKRVLLLWYQQWEKGKKPAQCDFLIKLLITCNLRGLFQYILLYCVFLFAVSSAEPKGDPICNWMAGL